MNFTVNYIIASLYSLMLKGDHERSLSSAGAGSLLFLVSLSSYSRS
jgi:hypothetical protein